MKINSAKNPRWGNAEHTVIRIDVDFEEIEDDFIPVAASASYDMPHGRNLFARAVAGEFGPIAEYVAPVITDEQFNAGVLAQIDKLERAQGIPRPVREFMLESPGAQGKGWHAKVKKLDDDVAALKATIRS